MKAVAGPVLGGMFLVLPISLVSCVSPLALHRAVMAHLADIRSFMFLLLSA